MQSLAVKYRPKTFDDVVQQRAIKQILQEQIRTNSQKNCYLFTGGAGTGKTTCARIFANDLNEGKGNPIEVDAASNNGVENVREIIDSAKFKALDAPFKVYIIDECHMLSTGAWNAMLKLLEEPPAQTVFILCTTDPQKVPNTILSRVQRYDFQRITHDAIVNRLKYILDEENATVEVQGSFQYEKEALSYIAKLADGGCRDAITMLDKCLSYSPEVNIKNVVAALGVTNYSTMFDLTDALTTTQTKAALLCVENVYRDGADLKQFIKRYCYFLVDVYKYYLFEDFEYLQIPSTYEDRLLKLTNLQYAKVLDMIDIFVELNNNIKWESAPKALVEAVVIGVCTSEELT